jgi:hypothetical protein
MEHYQLPGGVVGVVELEQQEMVNNTIQDEGAAELQPPGRQKLGNIVVMWQFECETNSNITQMS